MKMPGNERARRKHVLAVWLLNLIYVGVGNLYACGSTKWGWWPLVIAVVIQMIFHHPAIWGLLYLAASFLGMAAVELHNQGKSLGESFHGYGKFESGQAYSKILEAFKNGGARGVNAGPDDLPAKSRAHDLIEQLDDRYATDEFTRKLLEAERALKAEGAGSTPPVVNARAAGEKQLRRPGAAREAPRARLEGPVAGSPVAKAGSGPDQDAAPAPPAESASSREPAPGFANLGVVDYQPYLVASEPNNSISQVPSLTPAPLGDTTGGIDIGLDSLTTSSGPLPRAAATGETCKRCGATRNNDFSFCLSCGHSYAFA